LKSNFSSFGEGYTQGDTVVVLPKERIVCKEDLTQARIAGLGDAVVNHGAPHSMRSRRLRESRCEGVTNKRVTDMREDDARADRRSFMQGAAAGAAAGLVMGAVGVAPVVAAASEPAKPTAQGRIVVGDLHAPPAPPDMRYRLDQRYPVSYQKSMPAGVQVLMNYFAALSQRDLDGMAEQCHFPFASFEGVSLVKVDSKDALMAKPPRSMGTSPTPIWNSDHDSYLQPGCYDIFDGMEVLYSNPVSVNLVLNYRRFNSSGHLLPRCEGYYAVTNNQGRWGIELMSTIFTPCDLVGMRFRDSEDAGVRVRINHNLDFLEQDAKDDLYNWQWGPQVDINAGGGRSTPTGDTAPRGSQGAEYVRQPGEDPMAAFNTANVKSRLQIRENVPVAVGQLLVAGEPVVADKLSKATRWTSRENTNVLENGGDPDNPADVTKYSEDFDAYRAIWRNAGYGEIGSVYGVQPHTRVIHAGVDKVHLLGGATQYSCSGEVLKSTHQVVIVTWIEGRWGHASFGCPAPNQDRGNDMPNAYKRWL
jgi:hypothetical protein